MVARLPNGPKWYSFNSRVSDVPPLLPVPIPSNRGSMLTPKEIAASVSITNIQLSNDASKVVYSVGPRYKLGDHPTSALWLADTFEPGSARQITKGDVSDSSPQFHPDGLRIFFLSDNHQHEGHSQIYKLTLAKLSDNPIPITSTQNQKPVLSFSISPDGMYVAFISEDEPSSEGTKRAPGPKIWGHESNNGRLRIINLSDPSHKVRTLTSANAHVDSMTWAPDGSQILYRLKKNSYPESDYFPVTEESVSIQNGTVTCAFTHTRMPGRPTVWTSSGGLFYVQTIKPDCLTSMALWHRDISGTSDPTTIAYGHSEDSDGIVDIGMDSQVAVEVASGLDTRIDIVNSEGASFTLYETKEEAIVYMEWDMKYVGKGCYVFAGLRSSGVTSEPEDVWSGTFERGRKGLLTTKLSSHHEWFAGRKGPISQSFTWTGVDGQDLQGIISFPPDRELVHLPTVVVPHGGPYWRDVYDLYFGFFWWRPFLASAGYLVLSPNYRGSLGRGDAFARPSQTPVGTLDWSDLDTMVDAAIERRLADPKRLAIAGFSQGGFLASWACSKTPEKFKAAVVCSGASDWGSLVISSDIPEFEAELAGGAPWSPGDPHYLRTSPIRYVKNLITPLLIMHGEEDERVPATQSIGLMRGILREGGDKTNSQLVLYPREGHFFVERAHAEDVLVRLLSHMDMHLKYDRHVVA